MNNRISEVKAYTKTWKDYHRENIQHLGADFSLGAALIILFAVAVLA